MKEKEFQEGLGLTFIVVGFLLCCTGIGALLGIPMIVVGVENYNAK